MLFWLALGATFFFIYSDYKWLFYILLIGWAVAWVFVFRKARQKVWFFISFLILFLLIWGTINLTSVQNYITKKVTATLSDNLHTKVSIQHVDFSLFNKMLMEGVLVEDRKKDTLLYAGTAKVNITDWFFFKVERWAIT